MYETTSVSFRGVSRRIGRPLGRRPILLRQCPHSMEGAVWGKPRDPGRPAGNSLRRRHLCPSIVKPALIAGICHSLSRFRHPPCRRRMGDPVAHDPRPSLRHPASTRKATFEKHPDRSVLAVLALVTSSDFRGCRTLFISLISSFGTPPKRRPVAKSPLGNLILVDSRLRPSQHLQHWRRRAW